jgi:hypothetical protein
VTSSGDGRNGYGLRSIILRIPFLRRKRKYYILRNKGSESSGFWITARGR